ncbi:MAG: prolyl oligopeptidase family serine peptidase [Pseudomonadota bacterium]
MTLSTRSRAALALCCVLPCLAADAADGPLRKLVRDRLGERAAQQAGPEVPATRLGAGEEIRAAGRYEIRLQHDGIERTALVHVPKSYETGNAAPLVMALHGGGGGMIYQASDAKYGLISKSEQAGFIAVFPNGISDVKSGMLATWNAGTCCAKARDQKVDDVGFLRKLVEDVSQRLRIDKQRVFAIGMSNGAMMSYRLACEASDVFKGIMAVAGTDNTNRCEPKHPVPVLHVHARNDDRVLFDGGAGKAFRNEALVSDFVAVPTSIEKWVKLNRANARPERVLTVSGAHCDLYKAGAGGAPVELCVTETGGHSWPGGKKDRGETPSTAIVADDLMWEFFSAL